MTRGSFCLSPFDICVGIRELEVIRMVLCRKLGLFLVLLLSVPAIAKAFIEDDGYIQCENTVKKWASSSHDYEVKDDKHALRDLLFFLHIPRTGGRTYYHCFLKKLYSKFQECPGSYDKLRLNLRKPKCRLLSTHDDYSMISKLPKEKTSVVTILRNPVDRVFSTYEFSVEVAARFLIHPNLTSVARMDQRARRNASSVNTLDIWPWKYLVPWMREDLFARRDARKLRERDHLLTNNSYEMDDVVMPIRDYINQSIARDIVHNVATFQVAGLTNNSYFDEAHEVRHCVLRYQPLGKYVLEVAKKRLDDMLYVGLTENHRESAAMFVNVVGTQVISKHTAASFSKDDSEQSSLVPDTKSDANRLGNNNLTNISSIGKDQGVREILTASKLKEAYMSCVSNLRKSQAERHVNSLKNISPANFTEEERGKLPEALFQEIASLNSLDIELYNHAQVIFAKQKARVMPSEVYADWLTNNFTLNTYLSFYGFPSWSFVSLGITGLLLLLFICFFVNARRRTRKVKL